MEARENERMGEGKKERTKDEKEVMDSRYDNKFLILNITIKPRKFAEKV